jgi:hypothetical protein
MRPTNRRFGVALVILLVLSCSRTPGEPVEVAEAYLAALNDGDYEIAWNLLAPTGQNFWFEIEDALKGRTTDLRTSWIERGLDEDRVKTMDARELFVEWMRHIQARSVFRKLPGLAPGSPPTVVLKTTPTAPPVELAEVTFPDADVLVCLRREDNRWRVETADEVSMGSPERDTGPGGREYAEQYEFDLLRKPHTYQGPLVRLAGATSLREQSPRFSVLYLSIDGHGVYMVRNLVFRRGGPDEEARETVEGVGEDPVEGTSARTVIRGKPSDASGTLREFLRAHADRKRDFSHPSEASEVCVGLLVHPDVSWESVEYVLRMASSPDARIWRMAILTRRGEWDDDAVPLLLRRHDKAHEWSADNAIPVRVPKDTSAQSVLETLLAICNRKDPEKPLLIDLGPAGSKLTVDGKEYRAPSVRRPAPDKPYFDLALNHD